VTKEHQNEDITIGKIRSVLDKSMARLNARYAAHQEVASSEGTPFSVSFLYTINAGGNGLDWQPLYDQIDRAMHDRQKGQELLTEARQEQNHEKMKTAAAMLLAADKDLVQEDRFVTIEVAISRENPPVLMFQKGLPDWILLENRARDLATSYLGHDCEISQIRRFGVSRHLFVLESELGEIVYVDPISNRVYDNQPEILSRTGNVRPEDMQDRLERIQSQWDEFLTEGINLELFSFEQMTDLTEKEE
jgi:hypothetical protein